MSVVLTDALVDLINKHAPEQLETLRARHSSASDLWKPGRKLGVDNNIERKSALIDLVDVGIVVAKEQLQLCNVKLRKHMDRARLIKLLANIVTAVSSTGVIGALWVGDQDEARITALAAAGVSFIASISLLISGFLEQPRYGADTAPHQLFTRLWDAARSLAEVESDLAVLRAASELDAVIDLSRRANAVAAEIRAVEFAVG